MIPSMIRMYFLLEFDKFNFWDQDFWFANTLRIHVSIPKTIVSNIFILQNILNPQLNFVFLKNIHHRNHHAAFLAFSSVAFWALAFQSEWSDDKGNDFSFSLNIVNLGFLGRLYFQEQLAKLLQKVRLYKLFTWLKKATQVLSEPQGLHKSSSLTSIVKWKQKARWENSENDEKYLGSLLVVKIHFKRRQVRTLLK